MTTTFFSIAAVIFIIAFIANHAFQGVAKMKRELITRHLALDSACRKRTETAIEFLKLVKGDLKEKAPEYNTSLEAMKATLTASKPSKQGELESEFCATLEKLADVIRQYEHLKNNEELRKLYKKLAAHDMEIAMRADDYNVKVDSYNTTISSGTTAFMAKIFGLGKEEKFIYQRRQTGAEKKEEKKEEKTK